MSEIRLEVPYKYLWATKGPDDFRRSSSSWIKRMLHLDGPQHLHDDPIHVTPLPDEDKTILSITQGHHRARCAPMINLYTLPAKVVRLEEVAAEQNKTTQDMYRMLACAIIEADRQFDQEMRAKGKKRQRREVLPFDVATFYSILAYEPELLMHYNIYVY